LKFKLLIFLTLLCNVVYGQTIKGKVVDNLNEPIPFTYIIVADTSIGTTSNLDGNFSLDLPRPNSVLVFSSMGYNKVSITTNGGDTVIVMYEKNITMSTVTVTARRNNTSEIGLILDKKKLTGIESSIGSTELSKKGISNVEDGLKKVTGITFSNNNINVRGLGDRYNQITLNGVPIPSNNSDKKNIDLSLLPIGIMDNVKVKKSYSSEQWSNVGGAQINISSPGIKKIKSISYRSSFNTITPIPSSSLNLQYGFENNKRFGFYTNISLKRDIQNTSGVMRLVNKQGEPILNYDFNDNVNQITPSGVLILSYNKNNFGLKNTSMVISQNNNTNRETFGEHFDYTPKLYTTRVTPTNHTLFVNQLSGSWKKDKWSVDGIGGYSNVSSGENERKQFVYLYDGNYQFNNIDKLDNQVFWSQNKENRFNLNLLSKWDNDNIIHEFGYSFMVSNNSFDYQQKYYDLKTINDENSNINPESPEDYLTNGCYTELWVNNPASIVTGYSMINGGYYKTNMSFNKIDLSGGVRLEKVIQMVDYRDQLSPVFLRRSELDNVDILPYLSLKYKLSDKKQFKFSNSITTIRPRFREMVPFIFTEVFAGAKVQGNPNLINSKVYGTDLSFEFYPTMGDIISITTYGKLINNPIEKVNVATASGRLETYQNGDQSYVLGVEVDVKKKVNDFSFDLNTSYLLSQITVSDNGSSSTVTTNKKRPLQGSTPLLINFDIFYKFKVLHNIGLTYNFIGDKLNSVGVFGLGDIYQKPQHFLNLIYNFNKDNYILSLRVNNILNTEYQLRQQSDIGEVITNSYRMGNTLSISFKYKF